jgi:hypothetical protein
MHRIIIDDCIITKMDGYLHVSSIRLLKKQNPNLMIDNIQVVTLGNRLRDNQLIQELLDGIITYDSLVNHI